MNFVSFQKPNSEYQLEKDFSCQECHINEAVLEVKGSYYLYQVNGNFCGDCMIKKVKFCSLSSEIICVGCRRWLDQQRENERVLRSLDLKDLLKEIERRMKQE